MNKTELTCIECPVGCSIAIEYDGKDILSVTGNGCKRGKAYAESEIVCPMRVVTSTVRTECGKNVPVKTAAPVKKENIFTVMEKIHSLKVKTPIYSGDVLINNAADGVNVIATDDCI